MHEKEGSMKAAGAEGGLLFSPNRPGANVVDRHPLSITHRHSLLPIVVGDGTRYENVVSDTPVGRGPSTR